LNGSNGEWQKQEEKAMVKEKQGNSILESATLIATS
jgi:hypothetical protein